MNFNVDAFFPYVKKGERYFRKYKIISKCCCLNGSYFIMPWIKAEIKRGKNAQRSIDWWIWISCAKLRTWLLQFAKTKTPIYWSITYLNGKSSIEEVGGKREREKQIDFIKSMFSASVQLLITAAIVYKMAAICKYACCRRYLRAIFRMFVSANPICSIPWVVVAAICLTIFAPLIHSFPRGHSIAFEIGTQLEWCLSLWCFCNQPVSVFIKRF